MRPIYEAMGRIASCALAAEDHISHSIYWTENYPTEIGLAIGGDGTQLVEFVCQPHQERVTAISQYLLTRFPEYPIDEYIPTKGGFEAVWELEEKYSLGEYELYAIPFTPNDSDKEFLDGVRLRGFLYPLEGGFRMKEYVKIINDFQRLTRSIFFSAMDKLGYPEEVFDLEQIEPKSKDEHSDNLRGFQ